VRAEQVERNLVAGNGGGCDREGDHVSGGDQADFRERFQNIESLRLAFLPS
jgi:hypothetical protein